MRSHPSDLRNHLDKTLKDSIALFNSSLNRCPEHSNENLECAIEEEDGTLLQFTAKSTDGGVRIVSRTLSKRLDTSH